MCKSFNVCYHSCVHHFKYEATKIFKTLEKRKLAECKTYRTPPRQEKESKATYKMLDKFEQVDDGKSNTKTEGSQKMLFLKATDLCSPYPERRPHTTTTTHTYRKKGRKREGIRPASK